MTDETGFDEDFVAQFQTAVTNLEQGLLDFIQNNSDPEILAEVVSRLHLLKGHVGLLYDELTASFADALGNTAELSLEDGTKIEKKWSSTRRGWQHKDIASAVSRRLAERSIDVETGEVTMTAQEIAEHMLDYVQPSYWKTKPVAETKTSIIVRRPK